MIPQDKSQGNKYPHVPLLPSSDLLLMFAIGQHQLEAREPENPLIHFKRVNHPGPRVGERMMENGAREAKGK